MICRLCQLSSIYYMNTKHKIYMVCNSKTSNEQHDHKTFLLNSSCHVGQIGFNNLWSNGQMLTCHLILPKNFKPRSFAPAEAKNDIPDQLDLPESWADATPAASWGISGMAYPWWKKSCTKWYQKNRNMDGVSRYI